jgi:hypothetical protein
MPVVQCGVAVILILGLAEQPVKFVPAPADDAYSILQVGDHAAPRVSFGCLPTSGIEGARQSGGVWPTSEPAKNECQNGRGPSEQEPASENA